MIKNFTFSFGLVLLLSTTVLLAQPTITSNFNPVIGTKVVFSAADTTNVNEGAAGANITYDFSSLQKMGNNLGYTYTAPSATPYASQYTAANFAYATSSNQGNAGYVYLKTSATKFENIGVATSTLQMVYSDPQTIFEYPTTYNSSYSDDHKGQGTNSQNITTYRRGTTDIIADGWGTLILPQGTSTDILRVKITQNVVDSISFMGSEIVTESKVVTYNFYKEGFKQQLMSISKVFGKDFFGDDIIIKSVLYYPDAPNSVGELTKQNNIKVYPNPASSTITINAVNNEAVTNYTITDIVGKTYLAENINNTIGSNTVNVSLLPQGIFIVSLYNNNVLVGIQKLTISK